MEISSNSTINQNLYLNNNQTLNRIATGIELNQSSDNSSALAIANNLLAQGNGYSKAIENTNSAIASTQIASSAITEQSSILDNIKEKLLQASTDTTSQDGREMILKDIQSQLNQFDQIASSTNYNGQSLLQNSASDNSASQAQQYQAGLNSEDLIETTSVQANTEGLGLTALSSQDATSFTSSAAKGFVSSLKVKSFSKTCCLLFETMFLISNGVEGKSIGWLFFLASSDCLNIDLFKLPESNFL